MRPLVSSMIIALVVFVAATAPLPSAAATEAPARELGDADSEAEALLAQWEREIQAKLEEEEAAAAAAAAVARLPSASSRSRPLAAVDGAQQPNTQSAGQRNNNVGTAAAPTRTAAVGAGVSEFEVSVYQFFAAVMRQDFRTAHDMCAQGRLFRKKNDPPMPPKLPTDPDKRPGDKPRAAATYMMQKDAARNSLDVVQCMLESRQAPTKATADDPDWFGLTDPRVRNTLIDKAASSQHVGATLAFFDLQGQPRTTSKKLPFPHRVFSTHSHLHTLTRSGLFPDTQANGAAVADGASGIAEWAGFADVLRTRFATPDKTSAQLLEKAVAEAARRSGAGDSQMMHWTLIIANAKANIIYRAYVDSFNKPWWHHNHSLTDEAGRTVFHVAAIHNNFIGLGDDYLDAAHANVRVDGVLEMRDGLGNTALDYARYRGNDEVGHILARLTGDTYERAVSPDKVAERYVAPDLVRSTFETDNAGGWNTDIATDLLPEVGGASRCDIDERNDITAQEFLTEYMLKGKPLALRGYAKNWPFRTWWTRDTLMQRRGNILFDAGPIPYADAFGVENPIKNVTLRKYVETHTGEPLAQVDSKTQVRDYVFEFPAKKKVGEGGALLYEDIDIDPDFTHFNLPGLNTTNMLTLLPREIAADESKYRDERPQPTLQFFVGPPGSGAPPHFHGDAFNCLAYGAKRWLLGAPRDAFYSRVAPVTFARDHRDSHPQLMECVQYAGDVLYVPDSWVHTVINLQDNVGAAIEFDTIISIMPTPGKGIEKALEAGALSPAPAELA